MSLQEKKALVNIFSSILIMAGYCYYIFIMRGDENLVKTRDLQFWARFMLIMIPVTIVAKIVIYIVFTILNVIATKEKDPEIMDEFDKLIDLKATRNGNFIFHAGFLGSLIAVAWGQPVSVMFIIILSCGLLGDVCGELWKIYFYRRGV